MKRTDPTTPLNVMVREQLQLAMDVQGFNRHTLHKASGIAYTTIMRVLDGQISPTVDTVDRLFQAMNVVPTLSFS